MSDKGGARATPYSLQPLVGDDGTDLPVPHTAVNIPGAERRVQRHDGSPSTPGDASDGLFVGSAVGYGLGTSPGHGLGHLMRSRRRSIARQTSKEFGHLHSHDELGELAAAAESNDDATVSSSVAGAAPESPIGGVHWTYSFGHDELAAPLLPPSQLKGAAAGAALHPSTPLLKSVVFGAINATAGIPALVAYAAIVFKHPTYLPYLDLLCKFFFISSAVHQAVFCLMSALPFAMGQVQDVGIIFLSAMGTSVATLCHEADKDADVALGTALLTMTLSTFIVGLFTLFVARRHLAGFVQYLPLPVMGGYLSFVGYFCMASGIGLGTSADVGSLLSWVNLLHREQLIKLVPTVASTAVMIWSLKRFEHPLVLPTVLVALVAVFHVVLFATGVSQDAAEAAGWVLKPAAGPVKFWELWRLFNIKGWSLHGIFLPALLKQAAKASGLMLVVVFGSCMDIAAIQQDLSYKIDFDRELTTVAVSNMATGLAGIGFTGSYIFSQTIFTMRAGVFSRVNGWVIAGVEAAVFLLPYSIVQYLPNYFLGALLLWFGVEITRDWLVLSYFRLTAVEYGLLWVTFGCIMQWGLEGGIAAGVISATLYFAYAYARSQVASFGAGTSRSTVVRTVEQQGALDLFWPTRAASVQLQGFVFFGSAQSIGQKLQEAAKALARSGGIAAEAEEQQQAAIEHSMRSMGELDYAGAKHDQAVQALDAAHKFFVLDFARVTGIDSSGARTVAGVLRELTALGVTPVVTGAEKHGIVALLEAHDVKLKPTRWPPQLRPIAASGHRRQGEQAIGPESAAADEELTGGSVNRRAGVGAAALEAGTGMQAVVASSGEPLADGGGEPDVLLFLTLEEGLRFCEDALLEVAVRFGLCRGPSEGISLEDLLATHLERLPITSKGNAPAMAATLRRYMQRRTVRRGEVLWTVNDPADCFFLIEKGTVRVDQYRPFTDSEEATAAAQVEREAGGVTPWDELERTESGHRVRVRSFVLGPGCVAGSTDFFLARPHATQAACASFACRVLWLSRHSMQRMAAEAPAALNALQLVVMRANLADLSAAADAAARVQ